MIEHELDKILSIEGVYNTIINDEYTFRWFLYFIKNRKKIERTKRVGSIDKRWKKYRSAYVSQLFFGLFVFLTLALGLYNRRWETIPLALLLYCLSYLNISKKRKYIAEISCDFVKKDYSEDALSKMTLYQLCEEYSEKYKLISLVDAIYHLDKIYRFILIFSFFLVFYITNVNPWWLRYSMVAMIYFIAHLAANSSLFYKHYK